MSESATSRASAIERVHDLLGAFDARHQRLTLSMLAQRAGLPKTTVHRMIRQLVDLGWLTRDGDYYVLGNTIFQLGNLVPARVTLRETASPYLQDLYEATHATVQLAIRDGQRALYIEKISGHQRVNGLSRIGGHMPLHCTAVGKALLALAPEEVQTGVASSDLPARTRATITSPRRLVAELASVRAGNVAYDREEAAVGMRCIAVPVIGPDGRAVAALSLSAKASSPVDMFAPALHMSASAVSRALARVREFGGAAQGPVPAGRSGDPATLRRVGHPASRPTLR